LDRINRIVRIERPPAEGPLTAGCGSLISKSIKHSAINIDMAAKRHKKHKNKILGLVISMCYNEQKSKF